jgi:myo-inositol-1(or 4)-monophosphatase
MSRLAEYSKSLETLTGTCRGIRRAGSASLDLAYVAAGRMDGFWEMGLSKWDIAAGIVLVREAGGFVSDLSGGETFWDSGDIVAANPKCFKSLIQNLRGLIDGNDAVARGSYRLHYCLARVQARANLL